MTRYEAIEKALRGFVEAYRNDHIRTLEVFHYLADACTDAEAALALPEDGKVVNAELYGLAVELADSAARSDIECLCNRDPANLTYTLLAVFDDEPACVADVARARRYISLREASGDPMPYKVIREGDKVRFE